MLYKQNYTVSRTNRNCYTTNVDMFVESQYNVMTITEKKQNVMWWARPVSNVSSPGAVSSNTAQGKWCFLFSDSSC